MPFEATHRFADVSLLGPIPLIVPVLLAGLATWAAWRKNKLALSAATAALLLFCLLAGFSIGFGYLPGGGLMFWALMALLISNSKPGGGRLATSDAGLARKGS